MLGRVYHQNIIAKLKARGNCRLLVQRFATFIFLGIVTASAKHAFVSGETSVRNLAEIPEWMPGPAERKQKY